MRRNRIVNPKPRGGRSHGSMGAMNQNINFPEKITKAKEADLICSKPGKK